MSVVERSYPANVEAITDRMHFRGLSLEALSKNAPVSLKTLKRLLKERRRAFIATYKKLANPRALNVKDVSTLYIIDDDSQSDPMVKDAPIDPMPDDSADRVDAELFSDDVDTGFDETDDLGSVLKDLESAIRARRPIKVIVIVVESLTLRLSFDADDLPGLLLAFMKGELGRLAYDVSYHLSIDRITIPAEHAGRIERMIVDDPDSEFSQRFGPLFGDTEFDQLQRETLDVEMTRRSDGSLVFTLKAIGAA
jgi:hypothetical protein